MLYGLEARTEEAELNKKSPFGIIAHTYQPLRKYGYEVAIAGKQYRAVFSVVHHPSQNL